MPFCVIYLSSNCLYFIDFFLSFFFDKLVTLNNDLEKRERDLEIALFKRHILITIYIINSITLFLSEHQN